jgi:site-specific DNA-cytosine methylase
MKHLGDITKISGYTAPIVDCIIGGSPCQDLSVAGKRAGLEGERSGLYIEQIRIVKEMRKRDESNGRTGVDIRPRYMVWENVPGAFSSNKAEDFRIVLEELAKVIDKDATIPMPPKGKWTNSGCIMGDGWSIAWRVCDAQFWGVPQRRRRIALVADFGGQSAPEILFVRKSLSGHTDESQPKRKTTPSDATGGFGADDRIGVDLYNTDITGDITSTLGINCGMSHGRQGVLCYDIGEARLRTPSEYKDISPTITQRCGTGGNNTPAVITFEPGIASREGGHIYEGVSGTLRANAGDNQMATAYTMQDREGKEGGGKDALIQKDRSAALRTVNSQYLFQPVNKENFVDVEMEVAVRKYEVDKDKLIATLREHKGKLTNKEISEILDKPLTLVEHWFRGDKYFAIPDADIWFKLKELLGIETTEFDQAITEFEFKGGNFDMRNRIYTGDASPTLTCGCGDHLHLLPTVYSKSKRAQSDTDFETWQESDTANTLNSFDTGDVRTNEAVVYALDRASFNQGKNAQYDFEISDKGVNSPLVAKGPSAVCYSFNPTSSRDAGDYILEDVANPLINGTCPGHKNAIAYADAVAVDCRNGSEDKVNSALQSNSAHSLNGNNVVRTRYIVRRLTPRECEALQGYPLGWTDIGEWTDSKGKKHQTSDASRYKALGNSIALPPWKWVLKRLCACYERDATMASLFDGIGGFPYLWEQLNGKGTCLWASEIEEFPMAVTKARIGE